MANKFMRVFFGVFLAIFLIAGKQTYAQREIRVFEPDFNKEYALHLKLYEYLFTSPNAYIEFYSDYAKKHKIKKTVSFQSGRWENTIYYNKDGYITRIENENQNDTVVFTYKYSNQNLTITRFLNIDHQHQEFKIFYFNEKHVLDSTIGTDWRTERKKTLAGGGGSLDTQVLKYDTVKFIYCENGLLATAKSTLYDDGDVAFINPMTTGIGAQSNALSNMEWREHGSTYDSMGKFSPLILFKQKEGDSNNRNRRTTWSLYSPKIIHGENQGRISFELTLRPNYMLIQRDQPKGSSMYRSSSFFYEWNDKGQITTYSECSESHVMHHFIWPEEGTYYTKVRGGWQKRVYYGDSVANKPIYRVKISKKKIIDKYWSIEYFK